MDVSSLGTDYPELIHFSTYRHVQGPFREADSHAARQEIPRRLCNQKVHYSVHKSPP